MSKRFTLQISIPGETSTCQFKMKTRAYGDKEMLRCSIIEEFENGLKEQIAKYVADTFGLPTADEIVTAQPMIGPTQLKCEWHHIMNSKKEE